MGLDLRDHNCSLLKKGNQGCKWCDVALHFGSVDVSCCSRILLTLGLELITKDAELRKDPEIDAPVVDSFSSSATKYCSCRASRTSLRITLFVALRFNSPGHDDISSIWCLATLSILVLIVLIATVLNATHIPSCWSVLNNFDTFLILYAFWVRGHDGFYICNLCTLTWIWQCFCINAPHWLVFVRSGGIQILLSVWAASVVCRALWKILKVVSGITVQLLSRNFMHNMWQPRGTPDASRLPLDIQGAFDTGKGISTGLVLWPADLRWLLVAGCGGMWRVFFTEEHGADPFAGSEPIWAITGYIRLPRSPFPLWTLLRQWWCHVWTSWWVEFALDIICEYLWYLCGNYQVAGIEDSQSKQGTVLADATEPEPPRSLRTTFLECCCSKVEGALEHARQEKEKLGAWCAQLGKSILVGGSLGAPESGSLRARESGSLGTPKGDTYRHIRDT